MYIFYVILNLLGLASLIAAAVIKGEKIKENLFFVFSGNVLVGISYLFTTAGINGAVSAFTGGLQAIINYFFNSKNKKIPTWLTTVYALMFLILNIAVTRSPIGILALLAALCFVGSISAKNGKGYRIWQILNSSLWISYDILSHSYGPLATHLVLFGFTIAGMLINDYKFKTK